MVGGKAAKNRLGRACGVYVCIKGTKGTQPLQQRYVSRGRKHAGGEGEWKARLKDLRAERRAIRCESLRSRGSQIEVTVHAWARPTARGPGCQGACEGSGRRERAWICWG